MHDVPENARPPESGPWRRRRRLGIGIVLTAAGLTGFYFLRQAMRLPRPLRLLPDGPAIGYLHVSPLRPWLARIPSSPSYARFERQSGFYYRRDLTAIALSLHPAGADDICATAILRGHFSRRFHDYLRHAASHSWQVAGRRYWQVPGLARPVVLTWLNPHWLAVSNGTNPASLAGVVRKWQSWLPAPAPSLARPFRANWFSSPESGAILLAAFQSSAWMQLHASATVFGLASLRLAWLWVRISPHGLHLGLNAEYDSSHQARLQVQNWQRRFRQWRQATPPAGRLRAILSGLRLTAQKQQLRLRARIPYADLFSAGKRSPPSF